MNPILNKFFSLGDKVTKGDPKRKADFDYYMLWIIFLAFFSIFLGNIWNFFKTYHLERLGWAAFGLAIMYFQYFALKQARDVRKIMKEATPQEEEIIEENIDDMLKGFGDKK